MFFRYTLQQMPALFCVCFQGAQRKAEEKQSHISGNEVTGSFLKKTIHERRLRMQSNPHKLTVIDGETLMDKRLPPTKFCVDTLLPQGLCILGGSPKVGKSWLVLDLCVHVAQGTPLWGLDVTRGDVLYLCLEDSERRIQERLNTITDNVPDGMYFATGCTSIESGVCDWLRDFKRQHPEVSLIAIDTFQLIRTPTPEVSYGGDYAELRVLKELADELGICLLLVHHLRKMNDRDPVNKLSGSISTKLASRLVHVKKVFVKKVGREYRISKSSVVEFVRGKKKRTKKSCVVNVTSNPQD